MNNNDDEIDINNLLDIYKNNEILSLSKIINLIKNININDRCIIIIPYDIELYNTNNYDYINIREFLLKICDLKEIIYLPFGICNINMKLCIFNMTKKRNETFIYNNKKITNIHQTKLINFYEYNYFNNHKNLLISTNIDKLIKNKYSFNYTDYISEIDLFDISITKNKIIDFTIIEYGTKINKFYHDNQINKKYKIYGNNSNYNKLSHIYNRDGFNIIITKYKTHLLNEKIYLNNYGASIKSRSELLLDKYLGYYLFYNDFNLKLLNDFEISIPSIEIQNEIIKYLDNINNDISKLNNEINDLNFQCLKIIKNI